MYGSDDPLEYIMHFKRRRIDETSCYIDDEKGLLSLFLLNIYIRQVCRNNWSSNEIHQETDSFQRIFWITHVVPQWHCGFPQLGVEP